MLYLATVVADFGFTSLILDRDVIVETDAGPLLGPIMVAGACLVVVAALVRVVGKRSPWRTAVGSAASVYGVMILVGSLLYSAGRGELVWLVLFAAVQAVSPFVIGASVLAGLVVVGFWAVADRLTRA